MSGPVFSVVMVVLLAALTSERACGQPRDAATTALDLFSMTSPQELLEAIASELSMSLPVRIDAETELTAIEVAEGGLVYRYESAATVAGTRALVGQRRAMIELSTCRNPLLGTLLLDGRKVRYVYRVDGRTVAEIIVGLEACDATLRRSDDLVDIHHRREERGPSPGPA